MSARAFATSQPPHLQCLQTVIASHTHQREHSKGRNTILLKSLDSLMPLTTSLTMIPWQKSAKDPTLTYLLRQRERGSGNAKLLDLLPIEGPGRSQQD